MAIEYIEDLGMFFLDGKDVTYAIQINKVGYPVSMYF